MKVRDLRGKTALVTGAGSGIGRATALAIARRGADLFLCDISEAGLAETERSARELGRDVLARRVDVASAEAMRGFADEIHRRVPAVDLLVNNAGIALGADFVDTSLADWERRDRRESARRDPRLPLLRAADAAKRTRRPRREHRLGRRLRRHRGAHGLLHDEVRGGGALGVLARRARAPGRRRDLHLPGLHRHADREPCPAARSARLAGGAQPDGRGPAGARLSHPSGWPRICCAPWAAIA